MPVSPTRGSKTVWTGGYRGYSVQGNKITQNQKVVSGQLWLSFLPLLNHSSILNSKCTKGSTPSSS